ncbi:hypothetical protein MMC17_009624 [Xylographa soralifera]|nr:hypothetical protein [Xylographa soralifera]
MSRSAVDATRFTATSPHAYSKPSTLRSAASNTFSPSSYPRVHALPRNAKHQYPPPAGPTAKPSVSETAAQKVARLRAAHAMQKEAQISTWDRVVVRGRVIADAAHRFTALGLIGLTVLAGGVATFALGDMIVYNRRKRKSFFAEQHMLLEQRLAEARQAAANGTADDDQMLLINRERAADEAEEARKARKGPLSIVTGLFTTKGLKEEDNGDGLELLGEEGLRKMGEESSIIQPGGETTIQDQEVPRVSISHEVEEKRREGEQKLLVVRAKGGPLDQMAEQATAAAKSKGGWTKWVTSK